jgi:diguanylate cyclase (GGDEF)-like protein
MIDIDWFKKYNDFHGHQRGDTVLQKLVQVLKMGVRPYDSVYRYGGEEFTVLLPEVDKDQAVTVAERLKTLVNKEKFDGEELSQPEGKLTISLGVADYPGDASKVTELIRAADTALYQAKNEGRNRVRVYERAKER